MVEEGAIVIADGVAASQDFLNYKPREVAAHPRVHAESLQPLKEEECLLCCFDEVSVVSPGAVLMWLPRKLKVLALSILARRGRV